MNSHELREALVPDELDTGAPSNSYEMVMDFHAAFDHPVAVGASVISDKRAALRMALILEEAIELADAMGFISENLRSATKEMLEHGPTFETDLVGVADALGDLEYVVNGAAIEYGIDLPEVVAEIHRSNMTKLGDDGNPIYREDGKVLKGPNYEEPNIAKVLFG